MIVFLAIQPYLCRRAAIANRIYSGERAMVSSRHDFTYRRLEKLHVGRTTGGRSWRGRDSIGSSGAAFSTPTTIGGVFLGLGHLWLERAWAAGGGGQRPARQAAMSENAAADTAVRLGGRVLAWPAVAHSAPQPPSRSPRRRRSREGY